MLIVLDNARDADQVRPLLPGTARLPGRGHQPQPADRPGRRRRRARRSPLDLLTVGEARDLLRPPPRPAAVAAEPAAADELITRCARLPLALAIVAARAATHPHLSLGALAAELRDSRDRLDALRTATTPPPTCAPCSPGPTAR